MILRHNFLGENAKYTIAKTASPIGVTEDNMFDEKRKRNEVSSRVSMLEKLRKRRKTSEQEETNGQDGITAKNTTS